MTSKLLYPTFTRTRRVMDLSGMWQFQFDKKGEGSLGNWKDGLPHPELIPVPSSFNDIFTDKESREFAGDIWYETNLYVPTEWEGTKLELRFSGVTNQASVFVNGVLVKDHQGGYTPFHVAIDDVIHFNQKNKVVVKVSNLLNELILPIGETVTLKNGQKLLKPNVDFYHYAGIGRPVKLVAVPEEHVTDFSVDFKIHESDAEVFYNVETNGDNQVEVDVLDESGHLVATSSGKMNHVLIKDVRLWKPLDAYLYNFYIRIYQDGQVIDEYMEEIGIRTVEIQGSQLYINEEPVYLKGFYKWEDSELHGAGYNPAVLKRDFELMKWSGANFLSTADFPHCEEFYQMADREGFLIIDSLPASGLKKVKPSFFQMKAGAKEELSFFEREVVQTETKQAHMKVLEEVIGRDKNHACVIAWNLMTEPDSDDEHIACYAEDIFEYAHQLDKQKRPRTVLLPAVSTPENDYVHALCDIISLNRSDGWGELGGYESTDAEVEFEEALTSWETVGKPVLVTNKGAESITGEMKLPSVQWSEPYQMENLKMYERVIESFSFIAGEQVTFADFQVVEGLTAIDVNRSGVFTRNRQPKMAAYVLRNRWEQLANNK